MAPDSFDPVAEANAMADRFYMWSAEVDEYRLSVVPTPSREQMARLKDEAHALDNRAHYFTAEAIGATLASIQSDLDNISTVTEQAAEQLKHLTDVDRAIVLVTSVLSLGTAIAAGDPGAIVAAGDALAKLVTA